MPAYFDKRDDFHKSKKYKFFQRCPHKTHTNFFSTYITLSESDESTLNMAQTMRIIRTMIVHGSQVKLAVKHYMQT